MDGGRTGAELRDAGPDNWVKRKPVGADAALFRAGTPEERGDLHWTEGEKDALAIATAGGAAVSHHQGAAAGASADQAAEVARHRGSVVLLADNDASGHFDAAQRRRLLLAAGFPAERLRIASAAVGKDAADHIAAGQSLRAFVPLDAARLAASAVAVTPEAMREDGYDRSQPMTYNPVTAEYDLSGNPWPAPMRCVPEQGPSHREGPGTAVHDAENDEPAGRRPVDWAEFWATEQEGVRYLVDPLIAAGEVTRIYATAKGGKSMLAIECAAALATGGTQFAGEVLGRPVERVQVVYLDQENTWVDWKDRLSDMGYGRDIDLSSLWWYSLQSWPALDTRAGGDALAREVNRAGAQVVFLDTQSKLLGGAENDSDTSAAFYRHTLLPLKREGIAVVILDHAGNDGSRPRGSSGKRDDVDTVWQLSKTAPATVRLTRTHSRKRHLVDDLRLTREGIPLRHTARVSDDSNQAVDECYEAVSVLGPASGTSGNAVIKELRNLGHHYRDSVVRQAYKRYQGSADETEA